MKILHISPLYHPVIGGAEIYIKMLSEKLAEKGHEVIVFTSRTAYIGYPPQPGQAHIPTEERINGVKIQRLFIFYGSRWKDNSLLVRGIHKLLEIFFKPRLGMILSEGPLFIPSIIWKIVKAKANVVCTINLCYTFFYTCYLAKKICNFHLVIIPLLHPQRQWANREINFKAMNIADALIVLTEPERRFLLERGVANEKIKVVGAGIEENDFDDCNGDLFRKKYGMESKPVVAFVGRKTFSKGLSPLIACMEAVWDSVPSAMLVLAGIKTEDADEIEREINMLSQKDNIISIDNFSETEKLQIFSSCDVFALPSRAESFGIVYLEAWMCMKPVIGCLGTAAESVIDHGKDGLLVEYGNTEELSKAIVTLLNDKAMRDSFGRRGREKVLKNYTWDIVAQKVEDVYRSISHKKYKN